MKGSKKKLFFLTLGIISSLSLQTFKVNAGSFGAEIFCSMRDGGNDHESSWEASTLSQAWTPRHALHAEFAWMRDVGPWLLRRVSSKTRLPGLVDLVSHLSVSDRCET